MENLGWGSAVPDESFAQRVEVSAAREEWAAEAAGYVDLLAAALPTALAVDHIGSTSVPGLPAKDCLDLMVRVADLDEDAIVAALTVHGFRLRPEPWNHAEVTEGVTHPKLVFAGPVGSRAVNVHVRVAGGRNVRYALLFRDFLRADTAARDAWGAFKKSLAVSVEDLMDYGQIKATALPLLMRAAEDWAARTAWDVAPTSSEVPPVLGVDGCRAGWVGVLLAAYDDEVLVARSIGDLVSSARRRAPGLAVVAVDMPIGLSERTTAPGRPARAPAAPGRPEVVGVPGADAGRHLQSTHVEASAANREASGGSGLSIQAFRLVPKILEVDAFVRGALRARSSRRIPRSASPRSTRPVSSPPSAPRPARGAGPTPCDARASRRRRTTAVRGTAWTTCSTPASSPGRRPGSLPVRPRPCPTPPESFSDGIPAAIRV